PPAGNLGVRNDTHLYSGYAISPFYDAMIASTTLIKAINDAASTKDFDPDLKKQLAIALSAVFNDETVKRSLARIAVQEIDYLR
ncbi:hypothetical protein AADX85_15595, partial [Staphylococcus epidermidis]